MALQDEQPEHALDPLTTHDEQPAHAFPTTLGELSVLDQVLHTPMPTHEEPSIPEQVPHTPVPAPAEQFVFAEAMQTSPDTSSASAKIMADAAGAPETATAHSEQVPLTEYNAAPGNLIATLPPQQPRRKRLNVATIIALGLTVLLVMLGSGGLIYDLAYYQPHQAQLAGTATSSAHATGTVATYATSIAQVNATETAQPQATVQAYQALLKQVTSGKPLLDDALTQQTGNKWDEYQESDKSGSCGFKNGSYHAYAGTSGYYYPCYENASGFANFVFQVDMTIVSGDKGGVLFRADHYTNKTYLLDIDQSGRYNLYAYSGFKEGQSHIIFTGITGHMDRDYNQITFIALGNTLYFYVNQFFIATTTDTTLKSGLVGVLADDSHQATEVTFNNAKVWPL